MNALNKSHKVTQSVTVKAFKEFNLLNENFRFYVYKFNDNYEGLLGNDILRKFKAIVDYNGNTITINKQKFQLNFDTRVKKFLSIQPGEHFYKLPINRKNGDILVNNIAFNDRTIIEEGLYSAENYETFVKIHNFDNYEHNIEVSELRDFDDVSKIYNINEGKITNDYKNSENIDINKVMSNIRHDHLNSEEILELGKLVRHFQNIFVDNGVLSFTNKIKHKIITTDQIPVKSKIYRYPYVHKEEIQRQIQDMLNTGIIVPSCSPYNSPVWVVPKKSDASGEKKFRLVIDYRKLNEKTIDDSYPIPNIVDILDKLGRSNYFSILDLKSGFHQIEVEENDREKTAFSVDNGHYEFRRMPFGLKNAPSTFQRLVDNILRENVAKIQCMVYMDDIIVFSNGLEEHIKYLKSVFNKLSEARLKVQLDKCEFLRKEVEFLGHVVNENGVSPNKKKVEAIINLPLPTTEKGIKQFLGMTGYYRRFIENYAQIAKPLTMCLKKDNKININDSCYLSSFQNLKNKLMNAPILIYPDFEQNFEITTDASNVAIGGVLSQNNKPISFISRTLNEHEVNYSTIEKECLGIVWCLKQFRPYIYGRKIKLFTDHKPLVWLNNLKEPNSKLMRWRLQIAEYDYTIYYKEGHLNKVADCLSRIEIHNNNIEGETREDNEVIEHNDHDNFRDSSCPINFYKSQIILEKTCSGALSIKNIEIHKKYRKHIKAKEFDDETLKLIIKNHFNHNVINGILSDDETCERLQNVHREHCGNVRIVRCLHQLIDVQDNDELERIIKEEHLKKNHRGIDEVYGELKMLYYYPQLKRKITEYVNNCEICILEKYERKPKLIPYTISETPQRPNEIIHMDIFYSIRKSLFITMIDKFSKLALIVKIKNRSDSEFRKAILKFSSTYGNIEKIVTDNELGMKSKSMKEFLENQNINIHFTSSSNHNANSDVERLHNTINEHLRILKHTKRNVAIEEQMILINGFYNSTIHSTTKVKPIDFVQGKINSSQYEAIHKILIEKKQKVIEKLNENRTDDYPITNGINYIKESRGGKNHSKFRKISGEIVDENHLKDVKSNQIYYKTHVRDKRKFQDQSKVKSPVQQTSRRGHLLNQPQ